MIRKLLASCAALALACSPSYAAGWYPGFTGTGQVAPTGQATATPTQTASGSCNSTGGYVGLGDCQGTATIVRHYGLRAMSYQAAQLGVYVARVYGDGGTGDAGTGVYADVKANADGTPNFTAAIAASGATISIVPGAGVVSGTSGNPCFGGDGKCKVDFYDQQTQVGAGVASATSIKATSTVAIDYILFQNCTNYPTFSVTVSKACFGSTAGQRAVDTSIASAAQPYSLMGVFQKAAADTGKNGFVATGTLNTNGGIAGTATAGTWTANAGAGANFTINQSTASTVNVYFNSAAGTSLVQANGTNTALTTVGSGATAANFYIGQNSTGNTWSGVGFEVEYTTGSQTAAQMGAAASNQSAYYGLGF